MRLDLVLGLAALAALSIGQTPLIADAQSRPADVVLTGRVIDRGGIPVTEGSVRVRLRIPNDQPVYATAARFDRRVLLDDEGRFSVAVPRHGKYHVLAEADDAIAARDWVSPGDFLELIADVPATLSGRVVRCETGEPVEGARIRVYLTGDEDQPLRDMATSSLGAYSFAGLPAGRVSLSTWVEGLVGQWNDLTLEAGVVNPHDVMLEKGLRVAGRVVDAESGRPIEGARVGGPERTVATDATGAFTMAGLEPRSYEFQAWAKGWIPGRLTVEVDRHRDPAEIAFSLEKGEVVRGTVVDPQGKPLEGVRIDSKADEARTDAAGRFEIVARAGQEAIFTITCAGYSPLMLLRSHPAFTTTHVIELEPADVTITGRVRDAEGRPLAGVRVQCRAVAHGGEDFDRVVASSVDGSFEVSGCPRGSAFEVVALAPGFGEDVAKVDQQFGAAARVKVELTLGAQAPLPGIVVDAAGAAISGARVTLVTSGAVYAVARAAPVTTDEMGRFEIRSPFGRDTKHVTLEVSAPGFVSQTVGAQPGRQDPVAPIVLVRRGRIRGQLVDRSNGAAISHASLSLSQGDYAPDLTWFRVAGAYGRTGETADFDFEAPPGKSWLVPEAAGYTTEPLLVEVKPGATFDVGTIRLSAGGIVEGTVRGPTGAPATAIISLRKAGDGTLIRAAETDGAGRFRGSGIPPGTYEAFAIGTDPRARYRGPNPELQTPWQVGTIDISIGAPASLDVQLPIPAKLSLVLTGEVEPSDDSRGMWWSGCPLQLVNHQITVTALDGTALGGCPSPTPGFSSYGVVEFSELSSQTASFDLPACRVSIAFAAPGFERLEKIAVLTSGKETRVDLELKRVGPESRPR